jgi:hypothetical protein
MKRPFELFPLLLLHLLLSFNALAGGALLIWEPHGSLMGLTQERLANTPFTTYLVPGLLLFIFMGLLPLLTLFSLLLKPAWSWPNFVNMYRNKFWGWTFSLFSGIVLLIWITVQMLITPFIWLQLLMLILGLLIILFTLLPRVQKYYAL